MGVEQLQVQTDYKQTSILVLSDSQSSSIPIVRDIRSLRNRVWYTNLFWIPRECNMSSMLCRRLLPHGRTCSYFMNLLLRSFNLCLNVMLMDISIFDMSGHNS
ncbi:hypothetical protein V6N12_044063 [Hibiscus sabdariffa]|uniref:Uncharacterized protein n=1 Tax=Hibiscus sabdariffa TaxID=183260 RepID=A0ABR2DH99_9ROSI